MKNIIVTVLVLSSLQSMCAQNSGIHLIDSDKIIKDIKLRGADSDYYNDLDYEALIYLYPSAFDLLNELKPHTLHLTRYKDHQESILDLPFQGKEIKEIIGNKEKLDKIIRMVTSETDFEYGDIYFKSPDKAFVNISGEMWTSSYGFHLEDGKLKLKYEIKNIE